MKSAHDLVAEAKQHVEEISPEAAEPIIREADALIDVREPGEFQQGHIPGAINIPRGLLEFKCSSTPELDARDLNIVLYCKSSGRAALAAQSMKEMGYLNVKNISGGIEAWVAAGKAVVKPQPLDYE